MRDARILRIAVASLGDVHAECGLMPGVIEELNRGIAADRVLRLELSCCRLTPSLVFILNDREG